MNPNTLTEIATQASTRYQSVLDTFRGLLAGAQTRAFSMLVVSGLRKQAQSVALAYLQVERDHIEEQLLGVAQEALGRARSDFGVLSGADVPLNLQAFLEQSGAYLEGEIRAQLFRDIEAAVSRYREFAVAAELRSRSAGVSIGQAIASINSDQRLKFNFRDRIGRLYPAQKFIRSVWRHTMLLVSTEFYMLEAASYGAATFTLDHPDQTATWAGTVINLDATSPLSFQEVRAEVFHPNSNYTARATNVSAK